MYRTIDASGNIQTKFSFSRLLLNAVPNFATTGWDELTPADKDLLFDFQIGLSKPKKLSPSTMWIMGCGLNEKNARKAFNRLVELGIVGRDGLGVDTRMIGKNFAHQMAMLPVYMQKRTVCLLFEWEEEMMRWRVLEDEEKEIQTVLREEREAGGDQARVGHLEKRLMELEGLKKLKPSLRERRMSGQAETLPGYHESVGGTSTTS